MGDMSKRLQENLCFQNYMKFVNKQNSIGIWKHPSPSKKAEYLMEEWDHLEHNFQDAGSQSVVSNGIIYISE
jgi:hypothetical protein